jgi:hypothetical protein
VKDLIASHGAGSKPTKNIRSVFLVKISIARAFHSVWRDPARTAQHLMMTIHPEF